ncbi:taste receptor type 2 member 113-like [Arvicola amphibius]|uniref:taste receptor type 2 member 113-like n=1 Tax=Arvicola amphibius TaxID=1047088 RepID=UPI0018E29B1C|nr:taste receptor type 2 member 113-like [Arvicola amphibius]
MVAVLERTFTIFLSVEFLLGILGNGFIALVNCIDWVKRRKISSVDQILTALAISRITMTWFVFLDGWIFVHYPALHLTVKMLRLYLITWTVINHCNFWLTTSLSIFYFLKIANFSNTIFLYLKFRVKNAILVTLLVSLFLLSLNIVVMKIYCDMCIDDVQRNVSHISRLYNYAHICRFLLFTNPMFSFAPFVTSLANFLLLIFSLWRHLKNMQHNAKGSRDVSTVAHIRALETIIISVLLYTIYFFSYLVMVWSSDSQEKYLIFLSVWTLGNAALSAHPFVLIWANRRLRWAFLLVLLLLRYRLKT